jgi:hypothetical protein
MSGVKKRSADTPADEEDRFLIIKQHCGSAPYTLLHCPSCIDTKAGSFEQDFSFSWSIKLKCNKCQRQWWVCTLCKGLRTHLDTRPKLRRHDTQKHSTTEITHTDSTDTTNNDANLHDNNLPSNLNADDEEIQVTPSTTYLLRPASKEYFFSNIDVDGAFYLTAKAMLHDGNKKNEIDVRDVIMFMSVAHLVASVTRSQRELLAVVISETTKCSLRKFEEQYEVKSPAKRLKLTPSIRLPVPTSKQDLRRYIVEGKNALFTNLPHPKVHTKGKHSYLLPSECIADLMAHGRIDRCKGSKWTEQLPKSRLGSELVELDARFGRKSVFV